MRVAIIVFVYSIDTVSIAVVDKIVVDIVGVENI